MRSILAGPAFLVAFLCAVVPSRLHAQSSAWNVDSARAPEKLLEFTATEGSWISVDISPDGRSIAFDLLGHVYEMPWAGGEARALTRGRSWNHLPRYSPDGTRILFTSDRRGKEGIWLLYRGSDSLEMVSKGDERTYQGAWTADGRGYYAVTGDLGAKFGASRFDFYGSRQVLVAPITFTPPAQIVEDSAGKRLFFAQPAGAIYTSGFQLKTYDLATGEVRVFLSRRGGAASPALSKDGKWLAYVHRDDRETVLMLHELATGRERVLLRGLDRDRQESGAGTTYGAYPSMAWHPSERGVVLRSRREPGVAESRPGASIVLHASVSAERRAQGTDHRAQNTEQGTIA